MFFSAPNAQGVTRKPSSCMDTPSRSPLGSGFDRTLVQFIVVGNWMPSLCIELPLTELAHSQWAIIKHPDARVRIQRQSFEFRVEPGPKVHISLLTNAPVDARGELAKVQLLFEAPWSDGRPPRFLRRFSPVHLMIRAPDTPFSIGAPDSSLPIRNSTLWEVAPNDVKFQVGAKWFWLKGSALTPFTEVEMLSERIVPKADERIVALVDQQCVVERQLREHYDADHVTLPWYNGEENWMTELSPDHKVIHFKPPFENAQCLWWEGFRKSDPFVQGQLHMTELR